MSCKQTFKQLFLKCDIFSTSEFLRYNDEPQYRTYTGAFCSVVTVVAFCGVFMSVMISTLAKTEIIWSLNTIDVASDEFLLTTSIQGKNKFMFAVQISGQDLNNNTNKYFDINFTLRTRQNTVVRPAKTITLERCTAKHWNFSEQFLQIFQRMKFDSMLCPPIGLQIPMQGKFTSQLFRYAQVQVVKCNSTDSDNKTCANETQLQSKTFHFNVYILNTLINPESPDYISYYLEDRNFVLFTTTYSSLVSIFISNYHITTDQSITPLKQQAFQSGGMINFLGQIVPYQINGDDAYATFVFRRASTTTIVNRSFKKVDETFSYIGGLFGFVLIVFFFMKEYTEYSFEIDASSHLYSQDPQKSVQSKKFNFLIFLGYIFYLLLDALGLKPQWKTMEGVDECREEIQKQLDVRFLFERINFVEKALNHLFSQNQTKFLHLHRKLTLKEATKLRQNYRLKRVIIKNGGNEQQLTENQLDHSSDGVEEPYEIFFPNKASTDNLGADDMKMESEIISKNVMKNIKNNFEILHKDTYEGNQISKKIIEDLDPKIIKIFKKSQKEVEVRDKDYKEERMENILQNKKQKLIFPHLTRLEIIGKQQSTPIKKNWEEKNQTNEQIQHTFDFIN